AYQQEDDRAERGQAVFVDGVDHGETADEQQIDRALVGALHESERELRSEEQRVVALDKSGDTLPLGFGDPEDLRLFGEPRRLAYASSLSELCGRQLACAVPSSSAERAQHREKDRRRGYDDRCRK